jgi:hypothetical protein
MTVQLSFNPKSYKMSLYKNTLPTVAPYIRVAYNASHLLLSFGSSVIIFLGVIAQGGKYGLPTLLVYAAAWVAANVWYSAVEAPLKRVILLHYAYKLADKETAESFTQAQKATGKAASWFMYILLTATLSLSVLVNADFSEGLTEEKDSTAEIAQAESQRNSYDADRDLLTEQLAAARAEDEKRIADAKDRRAELIEAAKKSKGSEMYRLYNEGNKWAMLPEQGVTPAVNRATRQGDKLVAQAEAARRAPALQDQLTGYVTTRSASRDTIAAVTAGIVATRQTQYLTTVWRRFGTLTLAVLFVAIVFVQSGKALVLIKLAIGEDEDEDSTPGILSALKGVSNRVNRWAGAMIQEKTKDRLQFAVATPTVKRQTEYRQPTTPEPQTTRRQPTKTETQTKKRVDISVGSLSEPGKLSVTFEGKSYTLQQMTDKMRKWYARAKTAKSEKSRASNWHKYETAKAQLSGHLVFRERHKSVTIEKK